MKLNRLAKIGALGAVAALALTACAANEGTDTASDTTDETSTLSGTLDATGASSQTAAQEAWVANFQTANPDVTVNYEPTGSGTGRENFIAGASNFIGSRRSPPAASPRAPLTERPASSSCRCTSPRSPSPSTSRASTA